MDCLSYFSNSDAIQLEDCFIPELDTFFFQAQPQHQLHQPLHLEEALSPSLCEFSHFYEPFLPPQDIFLPSPKTEVFNESQDLDAFFPTPKHQKLINSSFHFNTNDPFFPSPNPNLLDSFITETSNFSEFLVPDFSPAFKVGWSDKCDTKKPELSAQSIAARKRRRRITEKTHELGKLIPGSQKHNTAEMFQAAAKYVKFLQAQIEIFQLKQTNTWESSKVGREMQFLLASQGIQEKLSTEEVCVVPREMVQVLKAEECILRNPRISRDLNKLL
ncbi:PREDICTED: transcription factor bHLH52-like [Camelina sativa]|uniref:Transcription factor bHLH52-like n=1 Tax=Camelina sativa TaxID=90675 RepID=A0ABM0WZQ2_CAMSA|nr:PREDICTED: transcription factor bHLH52-like [Camelina sativa]